MDLGLALSSVGAVDRSASFEIFSRSIDPAWIQEALEATGSATLRRRKLPAEYVVWIVIGMGLLRDRSIQEVVRHLNLVLPETRLPRVRGSVTGGAIVQARDRLGAEAMAALFAQTASYWASASAEQDRWHGLTLFGVDGSTLRLPDTKENEERFGRPGSSRGRAGYPQLRLVSLLVLRSHLLADMAIGQYSDNEQTLAEPLFDTLPDNSLVAIDRGFISYYLFHRIRNEGTNRHFLTRAKANLKWTVIERLGPGDELVDLPVRGKLRKEHPELPDTIRVRAIRYCRKGYRPSTLLTSLLDASAYPADEIINLYHERWEIEMAFDEIKTHTMEREETLRSREPERVLQEVWGLAVGYNLVRLEMERLANQQGVSPLRLSYRHSLMLVRNFWITAWLASPGVLRKRLDGLHEEMALLILPPRRARVYPRAVKIKMSGYPLKPTSPRNGALN